MTPAQYDLLYEGLGAWAGATALGSYASGAPFLDVATSVSGAAGGALGYLLGSYIFTKNPMSVDDKIPDKLARFLPLLGAFLIPGLASGEWDKNTLLIGVGAFAGGMIGSSIQPTNTMM